MKIVCLSDVHFCKDHADEALASLKCVEDYAKNNPVDMIGIAGDLFDSATLNSENARLSEFINAIKRLGDTAPTAMVYGTPSHDVDGSLEIFKTITCKYGITILDPGQAYFLAPMAGGIFPESEANRFFNKETRLAIVFGIPEPRKKYLLADTSVGKDETEDAIREAMHKMCFLLAAKRRDYAALPCIVLYHGEVAGSTLQNDQTIERGTGISITIDDLCDIGADYYHLGHIHKPQRAGNLPAYYAGSIYPKNFGETHQAGFNVVELTQAGPYGFNAEVDRVDLPHPQNMKIEVKQSDALKLVKNMTSLLKNPEMVNGKRIWLDMEIAKEDRAFINAEDLLTELLGMGAVPGSRVTLSDIPTETVRAAEITEVNTPAKKFEVWAENSSVKYDGEILQKIVRLESEITMDTGRAAGEWELVSLRLRGSIGIKKGIYKDEITLDFDTYADGLVALTGANGRGKTTLIENCHPYPQLLTRKGKLQDHFFLRDSFREVIYRNRAAGNELVKFLIQIDGQNKSGSCKHYIFDASGYPTLTSDYEWIPRPGVDGNLKPYEEALTTTFGPIELYQRTAHIAQRPTKNLPDLTDATAGEKKALFVELAGIDYLQRFADAAADKAKHEALKNHDAEIRAQMLQSAVDHKDTEAKGLQEAEESLKSAQRQLADITNQGKEAKAKVESCQAAWNAEQLRQQKEDEALGAVSATKGEIQALERDITQYQAAASSEAKYMGDIAEYEKLQKTVEAENEKKRKHLEANMEKQQNYLREKISFDEKVKALEVERDNLCDQRNSTERLVLGAQGNVKL
jgi:DNA repair exonuclease SbcCD nuclease subunit